MVSRILMEFGNNVTKVKSISKLVQNIPTLCKDRGFPPYSIYVSGAQYEVLDPTVPL